MRIASVKPSQRKKGRFLVEMEDGGILRVTEEELLRFSLREGMELDSGELEALEASAKASAARTAAANIIGSRPLSKRELTRRLVRKGAAEEDAGAAADWLEETGAVNDREYAAMLVRHYAGKGFGERKIRDELYRRGVPRELWDEALSQIEDNGPAIDAFLEKKLKGSHDPKDVKRASDALARRGYRWPEISDALRRYGMEVYD